VLRQELAPLEGQRILVLDTNCYMDEVVQRSAREHGSHGILQRKFMRIEKLLMTTVVVPREVIKELDRLKVPHRNADERQLNKSYRAREGVKIIASLRKRHGCVRGQKDKELYTDMACHQYPAGLRGDDAILNCCLFFLSQGADVSLCTQDHILQERAEANRISSFGMRALDDTIDQWRRPKQHSRF